jgi:hypothetical protein
LVLLQGQRLEILDHRAFALTDRRHVDGDGAGLGSEAAGVMNKVSDLRGPNLVLLGKQLTFGQEPPIHRRSMTAVRFPDRARCHARYIPPLPLPRTRH